MPTTSYRSRRPFSRRKTYRRRPVVRRRNFQFRRRTNWNSNGLSTKRSLYQKVVITGDNTLNYGYGSSTFTLSDLPMYGEFLTLFDRYRISGLAIKFRLTRSDETLATNKGYMPTLVVAKDYDDSAAPTSFAELQQYPGARTMEFTPNRMVHSMYFRPCVQKAAYRTALSTGYSPDWKCWIGTGNADVPYYGLKWAFEKCYTGHQIEFECTYYLRFKGVK